MYRGEVTGSIEREIRPQLALKYEREQYSHFPAFGRLEWIRILFGSVVISTFIRMKEEYNAPPSCSIICTKIFAIDYLVVVEVDKLADVI